MAALNWNRLLSFLYIILSVALSNSHCAPTSDQDDSNEVKVIGGVPAAKGEFPFLVSIRVLGDVSNEHTCGGTLVDLETAITSGHCLDSLKETGFFITAGTTLLSEAKLGIQQSRTVKRITLHPGYIPPSERSFQNDIAVLELTEPFEEDETVQPLRMAKADQQSSGKCTIAGWGNLDTGGTFSEHLMKGHMTINTKQVCTTKYRNFNSTTSLCFGLMNGETTSFCNGDTGGPLICNDTKGNSYLAGVLSGAYSCAIQGYPGVGMEIAHYRDWIDRVMSHDDNDATTKKPKYP